MKNNFKNIVFPIFTLFVIPIIVILLIYYTTQNKDNFKITPFSIMTFFVLLGYGYLSIILNKKKFIGPRNVDGVEPVYIMQIGRWRSFTMWNAFYNRS